MVGYFFFKKKKKKKKMKKKKKKKKKKKRRRKKLGLKSSCCSEFVSQHPHWEAYICVPVPLEPIHHEDCIFL